MKEIGVSAPLLAEDMELVRQSQHGDTAAFGHLYRRHIGRVYAVCLRITADTHAAEDMAQQAFVRAWEMLHTFRAESTFPTWLHRIAVNMALEFLRADKRRNAWIENSGTIEDFAETGSSRHAGESIDLEDAIKALPPQARAIFVLHDIEGYRHDEIAEQMGLATGTSKAQLHRARKLLKESLR